MVATSESSADEALAQRVRETMSRAMHVEATPFDELDVARLKEQPELLQQRHGNERIPVCFNWRTMRNVCYLV